MSESSYQMWAKSRYLDVNHTNMCNHWMNAFRLILCFMYLSPIASPNCSGGIQLSTFTQVIYLCTKSKHLYLLLLRNIPVANIVLFSPLHIFDSYSYSYKQNMGSFFKIQYCVIDWTGQKHRKHLKWAPPEPAMTLKYCLHVNATIILQ